MTASEVKDKVAVVTDSACDLPRRLVERLKITVVPLIVRFGAEVYDDGALPVSDRVSEDILALPQYPELNTDEIEYVADTLTDILTS